MYFDAFASAARLVGAARQRMRELYAGTDGAAGAADAIIDFVGAGRESPLHERSATAATA